MVQTSKMSVLQFSEIEDFSNLGDKAGCDEELTILKFLTKSE